MYYQKLNKVVCILKQCCFFLFTHSKLKRVLFFPDHQHVSLWVLKKIPIELKVVMCQKWVYFTYPLTDYTYKIIKVILNVTSDNTLKSEYFVRKLL